MHDPLAAVGGPELGDGHLRVGRQPCRDPPRGLPGGQPDRLGVDVGVGRPLADRLEGGDRLAELLPRLGVLRRQRRAPRRTRPPRQTQSAGRGGLGRCGRSPLRRRPVAAEQRVRHRPRRRRGRRAPRAARCWSSAASAADTVGARLDDEDADRVGPSATGTWPAPAGRRPSAPAGRRPWSPRAATSHPPCRRRRRRARRRRAGSPRRPARPARW